MRALIGAWPLVRMLQASMLSGDVSLGYELAVQIYYERFPGGSPNLHYKFPKGAVPKKAWGSSNTSALRHPLENAIQTERLLMVTRLRREQIIRESWLPWIWIFKIATHHIISYNHMIIWYDNSKLFAPSHSECSGGAHTILNEHVPDQRPEFSLHVQLPCHR